MMNEKTMVSDALTGINGELKMYSILIFNFQLSIFNYYA